MYYQLNKKAILRDEREYLGTGLSTLYLSSTDEILFLDQNGFEMAIFLQIPRRYDEIIKKYSVLKNINLPSEQSNYTSTKNTDNINMGNNEKVELDNFLDELKNKKFINMCDNRDSGVACISPVTWDKKNFIVKPLSFPNSITLKITKKCNLYCKHCCENTGLNVPTNNELRLEEIQELFSKLDKYNLHLLRISGGELFTRPDINDILNESIKYRFAVGLVTNLVDLDEERFELISRLYYEKGPKGLGIGTSIDGHDESTHDIFRGKRGALNSTLTAIKRLRKIGIRITVQTTIHKNNLNKLEDIVNLLKRYDINKLVFFIPSNLGRGENVTKHIINNYELCKHIMNTILYLQNKHSDISIDFLCTHFSFYPSLNHDYSPHDEEENIPYINLPKGSCNAGLVQCDIYENGNVYPCSEGVCKELVMGNIKTEDILDIWKKLSWNLFRGSIRDEDLKVCKNCFAKNYCGMKLCRPYAIVSTGDFYGNFKECGVVQKHYNYLLSQGIANKSASETNLYEGR